MITVNSSCIINLMYEVIKLAMCGSHGFRSDVFMRDFVHGDLFITFDDLSGHSYPFTFLMFLAIILCLYALLLDDLSCHSFPLHF